MEQLNAEQTQQYILQLEGVIGQRDEKIQELEEQHAELRAQWQEQRMDYETNIETLQMDLQEQQRSTTEMRAHYNSMKEQVTEMQGIDHELQNTLKDKFDAQQEAQRLENENLQMSEEFNLIQNENSQLRQNVKESNDNLSRLQTTLMSMKKEKREYDQRYSKFIQDYRLREEALHDEIEDLETRLSEMTNQADNFRQVVIQSEQEKVQMHNDFTAATMDLLADEVNASNPMAQDVGASLRLSQLSSGDQHGRNDSQLSVMTDIEEDHIDLNGRSSVQFANRRGASGTIAISDETLLEQMKTQYGRHDRSESTISNDSNLSPRQHSNLGTPRASHNRQFSIGQTSDQILQKLRVFLSRELIGNVKTMLGEELKHIDIRDQLDGVPEKLEKMLKEVIKNQENIKEQGSNLNTESLNGLLTQFQNTVTNTLTETLQKLNDNKNNEEEIKNAMNLALEDIRNKMDNPSESLITSIQDTMADQMTALQISLENQIDGSIQDSISSAMSQGVSKDVSNSIRTEIGKPLDTIQETVDKIYDCVKDNENNNKDNDKDNKLKKQEEEEQKQIEDRKKLSMLIAELTTKTQEMLGNSMEQSIQDRIDKFMDGFRKEIIPDFQAMFEQMDIGSKTKNTKSPTIDDSSSDESDDEKFDEHTNEYTRRIMTLEDRILELGKENKSLREDLTLAATSKAGSLLRLQNIIDHLRFDNRVLYQQLDSYKLQNAIIEEQENAAKSSWMGGMFSGFGGFRQKVIHVNISNIDLTDASNAAAGVAANAAVNVVARAVGAGINAQNISN